VTLYYGTQEFHEFEAEGAGCIAQSAFVLVAGGGGKESLGYSGINLAMPVHQAHPTSFLGLYAESILALQNMVASSNGQDPPTLPLVIMTSEHTHAGTLALLKENSHFGLRAEQVTLYL
jgi:UDP-sugar pyrophosphorylase